MSGTSDRQTTFATPQRLHWGPELPTKPGVLKGRILFKLSRLSKESRSRSPTAWDMVRIGKVGLPEKKAQAWRCYVVYRDESCSYDGCPPLFKTATHEWKGLRYSGLAKEWWEGGWRAFPVEVFTGMDRWVQAWVKRVGKGGQELEVLNVASGCDKSRIGLNLNKIFSSRGELMWREDICFNVLFIHLFILMNI